jgi:hypothetical protein
MPPHDKRGVDLSSALSTGQFADVPEQLPFTEAEVEVDPNTYIAHDAIVGESEVEVDITDLPPEESGEELR